MTVFGWTLEQWARAYARYPDYPASAQGARDLLKRCHHIPPGSIEGVKYPEDWVWAGEMAHAVNMAPFKSREAA